MNKHIMLSAAVVMLTLGCSDSNKVSKGSGYNPKGPFDPVGGAWAIHSEHRPTFYVTCYYDGTLKATIDPEDKKGTWGWTGNNKKLLLSSALGPTEGWSMTIEKQPDGTFDAQAFKPGVPITGTPTYFAKADHVSQVPQNPGHVIPWSVGP